MSKDDTTNGVAPRKAEAPELSKLPAREKLPAGLQKIVDDEETLYERLYDGTANESTESNVRYAAYATRLRTILLSAHRYVAYTSDIGESFRPVAHPWLIRGAYAVSWAYLAGDVGHEGYKAYIRNQRVLHPGGPGLLSHSVENEKHKTASLGPAKGEAVSVVAQPGHVPAIEDYRSVTAQRAVFQSVASMGLPAFTIHSIVRYSGRALKDAKNVRIRSYGPIGLGLAAVPFLPFLFDKPVEQAVEWAFHTGFETFGGPEAVGHRPKTGRQEAMNVEAKKGAVKEKEL